MEKEKKVQESPKSLFLRFLYWIKFKLDEKKKNELKFVTDSMKKSFLKFLLNKSEDEIWEAYWTRGWRSDWSDLIIPCLSLCFKINVKVFVLINNKVTFSNLRSSIEQISTSTINLLYWSDHYDLLCSVDV